MEQVWFSAALWLVLALVATMLSIWFRISTALSEIVVGTVAQLIIGALIGTEVLGAKSGWVGFRTHRHRSVGGEVRMGRFSGRHRRHRAHVPGWRGARSGDIPDEMERGHGCWFGWFLRTVPGGSGSRALRAEVVHPRTLAGRSCPVHHLSGCCLFRHAGIRPQSHRFWQRYSGRLLRE